MKKFVFSLITLLVFFFSISATEAVTKILTWSPVTKCVDETPCDPEKYIVYRELGKKSGFRHLAVVIPPLTTYTDAGIAVGTVSYRVTAFSTVNGESDPSNTVSLRWKQIQLARRELNLQVQRSSEGKKQSIEDITSVEMFPTTRSAQKEMVTPQRVKLEIEIGPEDTWTVDQTLAEIIHPVVTQLQKVSKHDHPDDLNSVSQWQEILEKMAWSFQELLHNTTPSTSTRENDAIYDERLQEGLDLFEKYFPRNDIVNDKAKGKGDPVDDIHEEREHRRKSLKDSDEELPAPKMQRQK